MFKATKYIPWICISNVARLLVYYICLQIFSLIDIGLSWPLIIIETVYYHDSFLGLDNQGCIFP